MINLEPRFIFGVLFCKEGDIMLTEPTVIDVEFVEINENQIEMKGDD